MEHFLYSKAQKHLKNIPVIEDFPFIHEFGHERYVNIRPRSLSYHYNPGIEVCYVKKGRYDWWVEGKEYSVYPSEGFVTCPWEYHGNSKEVVDLGEIYWLIISPEFFSCKDGFKLSEWAMFTQQQNEVISHILCENKFPVLKKGGELEKYFTGLNRELITRDFGSEVKIISIVQNILLEVVRLIRNRTLEVEMDNNWINQFNLLIQSDISRNWTIDDMSSHFSIGSTTLNDKVKRLSGFTPQSYVINLRIEKAKKELAETDRMLTEIALDVGFYSSQHFSTTFTKRVGISPKNFRKKYRKKIKAGLK